MTFPKLKNKHLHDALITTEDFIKYSKWKKNKFPKNIIITYQGKALRYFKRRFKGKYELIQLYNYHKIYKIKGKDIGLIKMGGIGAPNAVVFMEELAAAGGKNFINMGSAGGLDQTGVFLCNKSIRDEGTSHHYIADSIYSYPSENLTKKLARSLKKFKIPFELATSWTIDAPYRETKKEVAYYKKKGVKTVEMESAALFAVAKLRKINIASVFVVSDVLGETWDPQFHMMDYRKTLNRLIEVSIDCLSKCK